jgi:hypothetical protein
MLSDMRSLFYKTLATTALVYFLLLSSHVNAADVKPAQGIVSSVIAAYRTSAPAMQVRVWQEQITHPGRNPKYKEFLAERLREFEKTEFAPYRLDDPEIGALASEVIGPALRLYRREDCFKIIIIKHHLPVMMNDSGVLMMISTGLIERAKSDDEILGHAAHEIGHDLFWRRTAHARQLLELYQNAQATELQVREAKEDLAKIELECDAFSSLSLAVMGRNPVPFGQYLLDVERDFTDYLPEYLPAVADRVQVIKAVTPADAKRMAPQQSEAFRKLKALIASPHTPSSSAAHPLKKI